MTDSGKTECRRICKMADVVIAAERTLREILWRTLSRSYNKYRMPQNRRIHMKRFLQAQNHPDAFLKKRIMLFLLANGGKCPMSGINDYMAL